MLNLWLGVTLFIAILDWVAVARRLRWLEYLAKPGVMIALFAWMLSTTGIEAALLPFAVGIAFSLLGDVMLMLPKEQFILGLVGFFLAHRYRRSLRAWI